MAIGWLLVALVEFTAERISASPLSYLLPQRAEAPAAEAEASWPMPEERTVVAPPPERPEPEPEPGPEPGPQPDLPGGPGPVEEDRKEAPERTRRLRSFLRRREPEGEPEFSEPPRHVKLLPRRSAPQESRAAQEVAELFDNPDDSEGQSG